jgi:serine/threonine protein kinase
VSSEELASGKQLGPFILDRRLALGGMAEIWLAEQKMERGTRPIALKILLAPYAKDPTFRGMFADEVRIASRLTHENIVEVYGSFEVEGHLFQAMEIVDGKDLRRVLSSLARAGEQFPVPLALLVGREVARALAYAHSKRAEDGKPLEIVHRDISPHNVMITREGCVKVLDFGIASAAERLTRTRTGVIKGKISYMAPEQAMALGVSPRTDIFALGIVLWEMLAMQRLFKAESDAIVLERVVKAEVPSIREHNPNVPEEAAALLAHMLQQRATNRPESMRAIENSLTRILMRHFREDQSTAQALSMWAAGWLDLEPKKTGRFIAPELPPIDGDLPEGPTKSDLSGPHPPYDVDQTTAMKAADPLGASGGTSVGQAGEVQLNPELNLPPETGMDPTVRVAPPTFEQISSHVAAAPTMPVRVREASPPAIGVAPTLATPEASPQQRLPRRSEIIRAVDAQPTTPLIVDPSVMNAPVGLPQVLDHETERELEQKQQARSIRVREEGRVASGKVVAGEATLPPSKILRRTIEPSATPRVDDLSTKPTSKVTDPAWMESSDEHDFAPVKVGFSDAIKALDHARPFDPRSAQLEPPTVPQPPAQPPPQTAVPRWVYPTFAVFLAIIIVLLALLLMKG